MGGDTPAVPDTSAPSDRHAPTAADRFIELWGEMGTAWGVPRTMTQVHALLFLEGRGMNTDEIMARLDISRGNASMTLRTLVEWGMITRTHNPKDRKDYYAAEQDVWRLFVIITRARKRREIEPLKSGLREIMGKAGPEAQDDVHAKIGRMLQFVSDFDALAERFLALDADAVRGLLGMLDARDRA
jgi:DNA-binding transcriptional regulator GbsR (MarR family)